ncbi:NADH-ubiquinone oxidoreductase [Oceanicola granulosus HTCC2516]|uniref:NADH-ubiquinone oxidoreductase n=1 Tax=Oceanicola granulosus (strain ATCC BAA-861 / DSM 15982 / KCTC 12143 / HTCC2516) TaxID=314256 RepID=Q2CFT3_OCEGH|nr:NADH:ubiquinone oxidoreductase subunit NDUFA12 [Oceanicola granulosus]EAR51609.1 NADH-ubiquinone oxidoreductase [Oceanicola granulosus HTCC2516]
MGVWNSIKRIFTWWDGQTLNTQFHTWRRGTKVGEDAEGNIYYRNADDTKRWVIYNGEIEGSRVSPEWHGWLHHTWDEPPTERPLQHKPWEKEHLPNLTGTAQAYAPAGSLRRPDPIKRTDYEAWTPE